MTGQKGIGTSANNRFAAPLCYAQMLTHFANRRDVRHWRQLRESGTSNGGRSEDVANEGQDICAEEMEGEQDAK